jgi:DegV family protein with EDD domain
MKIITDTAALIPPCQGEDYGLTVMPVGVAINDRTYRDYADISSAEFLELIKQGGVPSSSQPAIGDILDVLDSTDEELLFITVGDGLSGSYQTAVGARNYAQDPRRIHVMDSQTLAGPLRYLARKAVALKEQKLTMEQIKQRLHRCIESSVSFVIPEDFEFLKRSGRLAPFAAKVGSALKLLPVLTQTKDRKRVTPIGIKRSWRSAVDTVLQRLQDLEVGADHLISICHAGAPQRAQQVLQQVKERFASSDTEILELSPGLTTHGGPGCIVIQAICK